MIRIAALAMIAACYSSPLSVCSDGRACSAGLVCDDAHGCIFPDQLTDCENKPQGASCSYPTQPSGVCAGGVCVPSGCGNGILEPELGEVCDDGNTTAKDGCSADCTSNETCGNGVIDGTLGEQCDDGNALSHDGCSSGCRIETPSWSSRDFDADSNVARLVYDPTRRISVGFAVSTGGTPTEIFDGVAVAALVSSNPLAERNNAAFARDGVRHQIVGFVGSDTLIWEGKDWRGVASMHSPPARTSTSMAWDGSRGVILLFGGTGTSGALGDTWTWDGSDWTLVASSGPPAVANAVMACDARRGRCVLEDGTATWEWDGATWSMRGTGPVTTAMDYDAKRAVSVAIDATGKTWEWDGATWTGFQSAADPAGVGGATYDLDRGVLFAFRTNGVSVFPYRRDGTTWSAVPSFTTLPGIVADSLAYDVDRGNVVVEGPTTFVWNGTSYAAATTDTTTGAVIAETPAGIVRFGGASALGTFRWNGATWAAVATNDPPERRYAAAARDVSGRLIMFGGEDVSGDAESDGWQFQGTTWNALPSGPTARHAPFMTYDARRRVVVYVGPPENDAGITEVLEWDGTAWHPSPAVLPAELGPLSFDFDRGVVVMSTTIGTWQYDGAAWKAIADATTAFTGGVPIAFDALRGRTFAASPNTGSTFAWDSGDPDEACLSGRDADHDGAVGCDDPDCWGYCTPSCPPGVACDQTQPRCGDGTCNAALENCRLCPGDCGACPLVCGDDFCDPGEDHASCPGDCP